MYCLLKTIQKILIMLIFAVTWYGITVFSVRIASAVSTDNYQPQVLEIPVADQIELSQPQILIYKTKWVDGLEVVPRKTLKKYLSDLGAKKKEITDLTCVSKQESTYTMQKNTISSAYGIFQFTTDSWDFYCTGNRNNWKHQTKCALSQYRQGMLENMWTNYWPAEKVKECNF